jgi:glycosyltransferase involved in cell wall biosynthesis
MIPNGPDRRITACIPYYRCKRYIRRAVLSLLAQTHRDIMIVVVNDGDSDPPWPMLRDITDPRLVRFNLAKNHGPYFITAAVLEACNTPYLLIQDADDWSAPRRVERLLGALERDRSDFSVSAAPQFIESGNGHRIVDIRWCSASYEADAGNFVIHHRITSAFKYRAPHHGLFRSASLRAIGGYYCGLKINYDTLVPNLILMIGRISHVPEGLYYRLLRPESLTHGRLTGVGSGNARRESAFQRQLYKSCFASYRQFLNGGITASQLAASIKNSCAAGVSPADRETLALETRRLTAAVRNQTMQARAN